MGTVTAGMKKRGQTLTRLQVRRPRMEGWSLRGRSQQNDYHRIDQAEGEEPTKNRGFQGVTGKTRLLLKGGHSTEATGGKIQGATLEVLRLLSYD